MAISDKTRKILWQRSGHRCAICRCELTIDRDINPGAIAGYEYLILADDLDANSHAPRVEETERYDNSMNLLVVCAADHAAISDQPEKYSAQRLREIKHSHEAWVQETLKIALKAHDLESFMLYRIQTGKYLISMLHDSHASVFNHDLLEQGYEAELVNGFFRLVQDHLNLWDHFTSREQAQAEADLDKAIWQLESGGFLVYGCQRQEPYQVKGVVIENWHMAHLLVIRQSSPIAVKQDVAIEQRMGIKSPTDSPFTSFILVQLKG